MEDTSSSVKSASVEKVKIKRERPCCVRGCTVHNTKLKCVPRIPKLPEGKLSLTVMKTYHKKLWIRREYCDRFGLKRFNQRPDLRYCNNHEFEMVTANIKLPKECIESSFSVKINVPKPIGVGSNLSPAKVYSKGNAIDRANNLVIKSLDKSSSAFPLQQMVELADIDRGKSKWDDYNKSVLENSGLNVHMKDGNGNDKGQDTENIKKS